MFSTEHCPNCKIAKKWLPEAYPAVEYITVTEEDITHYDLRMAPTFIAFEDGNEVARCIGLHRSQIEQFLKPLGV